MATLRIVVAFVRALKTAEYTLLTSLTLMVHADDDMKARGEHVARNKISAAAVNDKSTKYEISKLVDLMIPIILSLLVPVQFCSQRLHDVKR